MSAQHSRTVYLVHFETPYRHAKHYLGSTADLDARLAQHRAGTGARLMAVITDAGIGWRIARTWSGDRRLERRLKTANTRRCSALFVAAKQR